MSAPEKASPSDWSRVRPPTDHARAAATRGGLTADAAHFDAHIPDVAVGTGAASRHIPGARYSRGIENRSRMVVALCGASNNPKLQQFAGYGAHAVWGQLSEVCDPEPAIGDGRPRAHRDA
jgi:hypothetical protein